MTTVQSEVAVKANFSTIRYAQCWEDADILLEGLAIRPGETCLAIASAGDNALAMLTQNPGQVFALDLNPAQLACLELRVAAYPGETLGAHEFRHRGAHPAIPDRAVQPRPGSKIRLTAPEDGG